MRIVDRVLITHHPSRNSITFVDPSCLELLPNLEQLILHHNHIGSLDWWLQKVRWGNSESRFSQPIPLPPPGHSNAPVLHSDCA